METSCPPSSVSDLQDHISKARLRLYSMDGTEDEYEIKKAALEHKIQTLQNEIEAQAAGGYAQAQLFCDQQKPRDALGFTNNYEFSSLPALGNYQRPHSSNAALEDPTGFGPYAVHEQNSFIGHPASDGILAVQGGTRIAPPWDSTSVDTSGILLGSPKNVRDGQYISFPPSSPDSVFVVPQKRQRTSITLTNDPPGYSNKSRCTTPSPGLTGITTPTSHESFEIPEDMFGILGGDPKETLREMREEQRLQERLAEERRERMRLDEEYAKKLSEDLNDLDGPAAQQRAGPSNITQHVSQTVLDATGHYRRSSLLSSPPFSHASNTRETQIGTVNRYSQPTAPSSPPLTPGPDPFATPSFSMKQTSSFSAKSALSPEKTYQSSHPSAISIRSDNQPVPGPVRQKHLQQGLPSYHDFINLASDSDSDSRPNTPAFNQSSDLIELDPHTWQNSTPFGDITQVQGNGYNSYGNGFGQGNSTTCFAPSAPTVPSFYNTAEGLYNTVHGLVGFGGSSVYGNGDISSSYSTPFIDLSEDLSPSGWAENAFSLHGIDANDPANRQLYDQYMDRVDYVTNDPTRTTAEIKSLLENIRPDEDLPPENREGTPEAMTYPLMEHQKLGLAWLKKMEESEQKGGILADDMGLGKTIQALALMVSRRSQDPLCKTTLIVAPVALMRQWEREIRTKLKPGRPHSLKTFILHGASRHATWDRLRGYDVVLTTFGTLGSEVKRREGIEMKKRMNANWRPTCKEDNLPTLGDECFWYRVIIDEAQCIKNKSTKAAVAACLLKAKTRFCMTGTPMMNTIDELYSLVKFLRISPWMDSHKFSSNFSRPLKRNSESAKRQAMEKLQVLLKAILLRRTKKSMIDGKPILELPARTTEARHATFSKDESDFYQALQTQTQLQFNKYLKAGTVGRNYSNILVLLLRLRQACCHPHLIKDFGQGGLGADVTAEDMIRLAKELAPVVIARLKEQSGANDDSALECPVCMDMTQNATIFLPCGHNTCSECFARISDPSQAIANGDAAESRAGEAKCPNCRGKITPSKVIDHNTFKKVHMPQPDDTLDGLQEDVQTDIETTDDSDNETEEDSEDEVDLQGNLKDFIVTDEAVDDNIEDEDVTLSNKKSKKSKSKGKGKAKEQKPPKKTLAQLKKESRSNAKARRRYLRRLEKEWETSAKIEKTMDILRSIQNRKDEETKQYEKTIIFSQFTSLLDLVEVPINAEGWSYRRYDGSMNANQRNEAVLDFTDKKDIRIMLISLKAGNAGLNLTAASQVIILDPFWNPYIEEQAVDRAHRIGQMKPVQVHRILIPDTVEDRILALQEKKRLLIESALDEGASQRIGRLGTRDLAFLFDVPISS
ncbi:MAG: hypothetical protein Q9217_000029 [Psora testacea]